MLNLGIDLGGTNIVVGVVDENYNIISTGKMKTNRPRSAEEIFADIKAASDIALKKAGVTNDEIYSVGLGAPGAIDEQTGVITYSANLDFYNVPAADILREYFPGKKVYVGNDANAAAFGEFFAGAGKGTEHMVAVTLGTGVGSGIIVDGKILTGFNGAAGEMGHMVIVADGNECACGRKGCWETYASASALSRQTEQAAQLTGDEVLKALIERDGKASGRTAFEAMRKGSKAAEEVVNKYIKYVACGIINIINTFEPQVVCLGGGVSHEGAPLIEPMQEYIDNEVYVRSYPPEKKAVLKLAELGNNAGIIGAAMLYRNYED